MASFTSAPTLKSVDNFGKTYFKAKFSSYLSAAGQKNFRHMAIRITGANNFDYKFTLENQNAEFLKAGVIEFTGLATGAIDTTKEFQYNTEYGIQLAYLTQSETVNTKNLVWSNKIYAKFQKEAPSLNAVNALSENFINLTFNHTRQNTAMAYDQVWCRFLKKNDNNKEVIGNTIKIDKSACASGRIMYSSGTLGLNNTNKVYVQMAYARSGDTNNNQLEWVGDGIEITQPYNAAPKIDYCATLTRSEGLRIKLENDTHRDDSSFTNYVIKINGTEINLQGKGAFSTKKLSVTDNATVKEKIKADGKDNEIQIGYKSGHGGIDWSAKYTIKSGEFRISSAPTIKKIPVCQKNQVKIEFTNPTSLKKENVKKFGIRFLSSDGQRVITKAIFGNATKVSEALNTGIVSFTDTSILANLTSNMEYRVQLTYCIEGEEVNDLTQYRGNTSYPEGWLTPWSVSKSTFVENEQIVYTPLIDTSLPACSKSKLIIPFTHNPAVALDEVQNFSILFKDINNSQEIKRISTSTNSTEQFINSQLITYTGDGLNSLVKNTYYKVQVAYRGKGQPIDTLRYSNAGVIRCVDEAIVFISAGSKNNYTDAAEEKLNITQQKSDIRNYTGVYDTGTPSEVVYEYKFSLYSGSTLLETSGWQLHNSLTDILYHDNAGYRKTCLDHYELRYELQNSKSYSLKYEVKTVNGYTKSYSGTLQNANFNNSTEGYFLKIGQNGSAYENGYMIIQLCFKYKNAQNQWIECKRDSEFYARPERVGRFVLRRTDSKSNFTQWDNIITFSISDKTSYSQNLQWIDSTIEHGVVYKYALSRLQNNNALSWVESNQCVGYFEETFLTDGDRQLCIRFNPQVSSLKSVVQETKLDTIGGKYPFFFKNGDLDYMEIPISGLVSYLMDEDEMFIKHSSIGINGNNPASINLENYNIAAERNFKLLVLDWLNNGQPKYFRSPTEGNYIIRTLNNSLAPNTTVGRMLHTVTSTGYEVDSDNISNLIKYDVLRVFKKTGRVKDADFIEH